MGTCLTLSIYNLSLLVRSMLDLSLTPSHLVVPAMCPRNAPPRSSPDSL
jgi:hypothetical protein